MPLHRNSKHHGFQALVSPALKTALIKSAAMLLTRKPTYILMPLRCLIGETKRKYVIVHTIKSLHKSRTSQDRNPCISISKRQLCEVNFKFNCPISKIFVLNNFNDKSLSIHVTTTVFSRDNIMRVATGFNTSLFISIIII